MKKNTIRILANVLSTMPEGTMFDNPLFDGASTTRKQIPASELYDELTAELTKGKAKADANRAVYEEIHDAVIKVLESATNPVTAQELADETGYAKGKIVYGLRNYWADEVEKTEGKVNTYALKG